MNSIQKNPKITYQKNKRLDILKTVVSLIFFLMISQRLFSALHNHYIEIDKLIFLDRGEFFTLYVKRDFINSKWKDLESYDSQKFAEYFYGGLITLYSGSTSQQYLTKIGLYDFEWQDIYFSKNTVSEDLPWHHIIKYTRLAVLFFFTIPTFVIIFLIAKMSRNSLFGLIVVFVLHSQSIFTSYMSRSMGDPMLWFFSFLSLLLSILLIKNNRLNFYNKSLMLILSLGLTIGLSISTKLNGVINLIPTSIILFLYPNQKNISVLIKTTMVIFAICLISITTFIILNPITWDNPQSTILKISDHRFKEFEKQQNRVPDHALTTLPQRLNSIKTMVFPNFYSDAIILALFAIISFYFHKYIQKPTINPINKTQKQVLEQKQMATTTVYIWILSWVVITAIMIPLAWDRYYIPFIILDSFLKAEIIYLIIKIMTYSNLQRNKIEIG